MEELLGTYILLPTVYFMCRSGELANERNRNPVIWRALAFLSSLTMGILLGITSILAAKTLNRTGLIILFCVLFLAGNLVGGNLPILRLKKRRTKYNSVKKRIYRKYSMADAVLFPRIIPRGGFLWRSIAFWIFTTALHLIGFLLSSSAQGILQSLSFFQAIIPIILFSYFTLGIACYCLWYYISYICIPRIRDAGLSRDTLILLFIPGLNFVALCMLLLKPTNLSGRSSI